MFRLLLIISSLFLVFPLSAQQTQLFATNVQTVALWLNNAATPTVFPVMRQGAGDHITIGFDELSHDYHRYTYKVEHLNAEFQPTEGLFESDYLQTTTDEPLIEDYEQSMNTTQLYTHYSITLPNAYVRPLISGNYRLTAYDDNDEGEAQPLFSAYFAISEEAATINASATTDTEIDRNDRHQQLTVIATWPDRLAVRDAESEVRLLVVPNECFGNAVVAPKPTGQTFDGFRWEHCRGLIFPAGNEYRKFEIPSTRYPGMHANSVRYFEPYYHVELMPDEPRRNYLYDEDQNGRFVPLAGNSSDANAEADYVWTHFTLHVDEPLENASVSVDGRWTANTSDNRYALRYNADAHAYEGSVFLKQGYYSYRYVAQLPTGERTSAPIEGDFFQTENEYTFLLYYRQTGARYDRLVAHRTASYRPR